MNSLIKLGQYVKHVRTQKGTTQLELAMQVFDSPRYEFIGRLVRGKFTGITFR